MKHKQSFWSRLGLDLRKNYILYIMILPAVIYYILFAYVPMAGIQLAFKEYSIKRGIWGSPWVGWEHFSRFFFCLQLYGAPNEYHCPGGVFDTSEPDHTDSICDHAELRAISTVEEDPADGHIFAVFYLDRCFGGYVESVPG